MIIRRLVSLLLSALLLIAPGVAMATEEPVFEKQLVDREFSVRQYRSFIVAETFVAGQFEEASSAGFRRLADYIFGNNRKVGSGNAEKIAMTAPVTAEAVPEKIAMTAPVTMEANGPRWRIHFVMPGQYSLETLPRPVNPEVALRQVPPVRRKVRPIARLGQRAWIASGRHGAAGPLQPAMDPRRISAQRSAVADRMT